MKKLCPNYEREDALDTVLEVPLPEEVFNTASCPSKNGAKPKKLSNPTTWSRFTRTSSTVMAVKNTELQLLLGVIGAPLVPLPVEAPNHSINYSIKQEPIEMATARYIVRQYVAATGGEKALEATNSMYAIGKVKMSACDVVFPGGGTVSAAGKKMSKNGTSATSTSSSCRRLLSGGDGGGGGGGQMQMQMGSFVFWHKKKPDLWCLELVVSGCKISAGSDGKVAWRQTPWHPPHASRGPPRPLRRALQGLDPLSTANLFSAATCTGEKTINGEGCYVLRLDADAFTLRSRNTTNVDVLRHTVFGSFSHRTGLLVHLEDSHLLRVKSTSGSNSSTDQSVYWEATMESFLEDYRPIDGILIAHSGRTVVSLFRFGDSPDTYTKTRMEETWTIEEIEFDVRGLSKDCFLPPADVKKDAEGHDMFVRPQRPYQIVGAASKGGNHASLTTPNGGCVVRPMPSSKVAAVEEWIESSTFTNAEVNEDEDEDVDKDEVDVSTPYPIHKPDCIIYPL